MSCQRRTINRNYLISSFTMEQMKTGLGNELQSENIEEEDQAR